MEKIYVINNIDIIVNGFKEDCLSYEQDIESELIITCLRNNNDREMLNQLNLVTYAGPLFNEHNLA